MTQQELLFQFQQAMAAAAQQLQQLQKQKLENKPPTKAQLTMPPMNHHPLPHPATSGGAFGPGMLHVPPPRLELPPEETTDLEELEQFAKMFKQRRIKLGRFGKFDVMEIIIVMVTFAG